MKEIQAFEELFKADWRQLLLAMAVVLVAVVVLKKFYNETIGLFGIETSSMKKEREHKKEIEDIKTEMDEFRERQAEAITVSNENDARLNKEVSDIKQLLTSHIVASMRSTLWRIHNEACKQGYITREGLKTFMECGNLYVAAGGDDIYHDKLHPEVIALPVHDDN